MAPVRSLALASLLPLVMAVAACGDSESASESTDAGASTGSTSTVDEAFVKRADAVCEPYASYTATNFLQLAGFNRYAPDPDLLPQVAAHLEKNPVYKELVPGLEALGDPESGAAAWTTVMDDFRATAQTVQDEAAAARGADPERFSSLVSQLEQDTTELYTDLSPAGLSGTSCGKAEGDPLKQKTAGG